MTSRAICYTCTEDYLFPTLLSSIQASSKLASGTADTLIFNIGARSAATDLFAQIASGYGVSLQIVDSSVLEGMHVMFARLFLDRFVPEQYTQLLYLDGDTQVPSSLEPLLRAEPAHLMAVRDAMTLMENEEGATCDHIRATWDRASIPRSARSRYFNSGILRINRDTWSAIAEDCARLYKADPAGCPFPDQDALNRVVGDRCELVSFKYNFPGFLLPYDFRKLAEPSVVHFMSNPRPWHGAFFPWGSSFHEPYLRLIHRHPELAALRPRLAPPRLAKYTLQQLYKRGTDRFTWATRSVLETFRSLEQLVAL